MKSLAFDIRLTPKAQRTKLRRVSVSAYGSSPVPRSAFAKATRTSDHMDGLAPAIAIKQKNQTRNHPLHRRHRTT